MGEGPSLAKPAGCATRSANWPSALSCCSLAAVLSPAAGRASSRRKGLQRAARKAVEMGNRRGTVLLAASCRYRRVHQWPGTPRSPSLPAGASPGLPGTNKSRFSSPPCSGCQGAVRLQRLLCLSALEEHMGRYSSLMGRVCSEFGLVLVVLLCCFLGCFFVCVVVVLFWGFLGGFLFWFWGFFWCVFFFFK